MSNGSIAIQMVMAIDEMKPSTAWLPDANAKIGEMIQPISIIIKLVLNAVFLGLLDPRR